MVYVLRTDGSDISAGRHCTLVVALEDGTEAVAKVAHATVDDIVITEDEFVLRADAIRAHIEANRPEEPVDMRPNPATLLNELEVALGLVRANELLRLWPVFSVALSAQNYGKAAEIIGLALAAGDITPGEAATVRAAVRAE